MIYKYEVINPITNKQKPFLNKNKILVIPKPNRKYKYFVEAIFQKPNGGEKNYVLLLGINKFDEQCKKCSIDDYNRLKIRVGGELLKYLIDENNAHGNINIEYLESEDTYDVYEIK